MTGRNRDRALSIVLWVLQILLALQFAMAGLAKVFGDPAMVEMFATIGIGQWFRYVVGALEVDGQKIKGIEVIGYERPLGAEPGEEIKTRVYSNTGNTLDYVYELDGDTLTIWAGEKGSPAYYRGTFGAYGDTLTGAWHFPGGGGYEATATRIG